MPAEQLAAGGSGKARGRKPDIYADEKSDACIVPMNDPNNGAASKPAPAEGREGRRAAKRNAEQPPAPRTQSRTRASMGLDGVREAARALKASGKEVRFTALMHHITPQLLIESFMHLKRTAAAGVDGVTWREYEEGLAGSGWWAMGRGAIRPLPCPAISAGVHSKAGRQSAPAGHCRAGGQDRPASGGHRPDADLRGRFLGFSYGFRPGRSQHQALDALCVGLLGRG